MTVFKNSKPEILDEPEETIPVVPYADYDWKNLSGDEYLKYDDDKYTSMFGIDVSAHQELIDWDKVKQAGVEFAYIRLGYRGAIEAKLNVDQEFEYNYKNATRVGIKVGVYWYSQPINEKEAAEEAQFVLRVLNGRHLDLPIAYDFEETEFADGTPSRMHGMSKEDRTKMAVAFLEEMKKHDENPIIYTYLYWADNYYDWNYLDEYPVWFARYGVDYPDWDRPFVIWQYSDSGKVDGINNDVDLDIMFICKNDQN